MSMANISGGAAASDQVAEFITRLEQKGVTKDSNIDVVRQVLEQQPQLRRDLEALKNSVVQLTLDDGNNPLQGHICAIVFEKELAEQQVALAGGEVPVGELLCTYIRSPENKNYLIRSLIQAAKEKNINIYKSPSAQKPLLLALQENKSEVFKLLLENIFVDIDALNAYEENKIIEADFSGNVTNSLDTVLTVLIKDRDEYNNTLLMIAAKRGDREIVSHLLHQMLKFVKLNKELGVVLIGFNFLNRKQESNIGVLNECNPEMLDFIIEELKEYKVPVLISFLCPLKDQTMAENLLSKFDDLNIDLLYFLLNEAMHLKNINLIKAILAKSGDLTEKLLTMRDEQGNTPLHNALSTNSVDIISIFTAKANAENNLLSMQNNTGETALHIAAKTGRGAAVEVLIAAAKEQGKLAELLMTTDNQNMTAWQAAEAAGQAKLAHRLITVATEKKLGLR